MNTAQFKSKIDKFLMRTKLPPSTFGRKAMNDSKFYSFLVNGRSPTLDTVERIETFMRNYKKGDG